MKIATFDSGILWDDPNFYWGDPSYLLEPGDPGYTPPLPPTPTKPKKPKKTRKYMASNPTPDPIGELTASGEDLCDGLNQHGAAIGIKQNTFAIVRADLDALIAAQNALNTAQGAEPDAYTALRSADSNGKGFIARAVKVLSISLGNDWSAAWIATPLGGGRVLVQIDGARRANSFNFYKQAPADTAPVKLLNTQGTQQTFEGLPAGATVAFTVTGVNDAGEGAASDPVSVVVT